jgi:glycosyltransferase involved in cell wall biosynthesis
MRIAVLIPCFNEEAAIGEVVRGFSAELPHAQIVVFDNNSTDRTVARAMEAGARVAFERRQGKGFVVRRMFQEIDADIYVMVDGDNTYPPEAVHRLIEPIVRGDADMVVGSRLRPESHSAFRRRNRWGNRLFAALFSAASGLTFTDIFSGYRAFSRSFVRAVPLSGGGFEVEAELTVKAVQSGFRITEIPVNLAPRPPLSQSKIRIVRDGFIILLTILALVRDYKPLTSFGLIGLVFFAASAVVTLPMIVEYARSGAVAGAGAAVIAASFAVFGMVFVASGLILHSVSRHFQGLAHRLANIERGMTEDGRDQPVDDAREAVPASHAPASRSRAKDIS